MLDIVARVGSVVECWLFLEAEVGGDEGDGEYRGKRRMCISDSSEGVVVGGASDGELVDGVALDTVGVTVDGVVVDNGALDGALLASDGAVVEGVAAVYSTHLPLPTTSRV